MRLLIDQDVYAATISLLKSTGHDVVRSGEVLGPTASDASILELAQREGRVVVTRDHDYGRLVHGGPGSDAGVLLLRFRGKAVDEVHAQ